MNSNIRIYNTSMLKKFTQRAWRSLERRANAIKIELISKSLANLNLPLLLDSTLAHYYEKTSNFITWDVTPLRGSQDFKQKPIENYYLHRKLSNDDLIPFPNPFGERIVIVVQGQIVERNNVTMKIVDHYLKHFDKIRVILSTWDDTPTKLLSEFDTLLENPRFEIILNQAPDFAGVFNVNNQIVSTRKALIRAGEQSAFAIKTRTDQLLSSPSLLKNLYALWLAHGETNEAEPKIVVSSLNTFGFRLYGASDMFQFGKTTTLKNFWDQSLDCRPESELTQPSVSMRTEGRKRVAEVHLNSNYFMKIKGKTPSFSWTENLEFIRDSFVIIDQQALGQIWTKNTNLANRWESERFPHKYYEFSHLDWVSMNKGLDQWIDLDSLLDSEEFFEIE